MSNNTVKFTIRVPAHIMQLINKKQAEFDGKISRNAIIIEMLSGKKRL